MRVLLVAALVFVAALAGCSGKKADDELHYTCSDGTVIHEDDYEGVVDEVTEDFLKTKCPKTTTTTSTSKTTTSQAPNKLPKLVLKVSDAAGAVTNVTLKNGNLTFDATGSSDEDGSIQAIAISVQDSNTTRTLPLYDLATKTFKTATFKFDRPGVVNVSIAMVDDRAGFAGLVTKAYINDPQHLASGTLQLPFSVLPSAVPIVHPCRGADLDAQSNLVDSNYFKSPTFATVPGATFVEAIPGADNVITICGFDGEPISAEKQTGPITSTNTAPLATPPSTDNYFVGVYVSTPNTDVSVDVIVHYEPRAV